MSKLLTSHHDVVGAIGWTLTDERQQKAGLGSVWRLFDRHGISFKKAFGRPSRIGLMLPRRERHGRTINLSSIPTDRSSSTKPAPQPKWRARAARAQRRFGNGTISSGLIAGLRFTDAIPIALRPGRASRRRCLPRRA